MKKTLLSALVVIAITAQLTGCSGNTPAQQPNENSSVVSEASEPQSSTVSTTSSTSETSKPQSSTTATTSSVTEVSEPHNSAALTTSSEPTVKPAQYSPETDFVIWYQRVGGLTITGYEGNGGDVVIPEEFEGKSGEGMAVTGIGLNPVTHKGAFDDITSITSITIPKTVCGVNSLFNGCTSLSSINVDSSNKNLASVDGMLCERTENGLRLIRCPEGKKGKAVIPDSVTEIAEGAFYGCGGITEIVVGNGVTKVNKDILNGCDNLKHLTLGNGISNFGRPSYLIADMGDTLEDFASLESVVFGDGLTKLGDCAFDGCTSLKKVVFGKGLTTIGEYAFAGCKNLTDINIPKSVTNVTVKSFSGTAWLENKRKENPLVVINGILIDGATCSGNITIPQNVTEIGAYAFAQNNSITSVTVPNGVTHIWGGAFSECASLKKVTLPNSITFVDCPVTMGYPAFYESPNATVTYKGKTYTQSNIFDLYGLFNELY